MLQILHKLKKKKEDGSLWDMVDEAKWMYGFARKYWGAILYYIVLGVLGTVMSLASSVASKYLIDVVTGGEVGRLSLIISVMIGMQLGSVGVNAVASRISMKITLRVNREIQAAIYEKIMNTDWESLSGFRSGDIMNRFSRDVDTVAENVIGLIPSFITKGVQFLGALVLILYYDPTMALLALVSAPVTFIFARILTRKMRYYSKKMREMSSSLMAFQQESFFNIQQIKAFDLIPVFEKKLSGVQQEYIDTSLEYNKFSIASSSVISIVGMLTALGCFGWGTYRLWSGAITFGTMTLFLQMSGYLRSSFSSLVNMVPGTISATTAAGRIMEIAELPKENEGADIDMACTADFHPEMGISVSMKDTGFHYQTSDVVLSGVNVEAHPGEIIALVGPSGQGKTTTIRILLGLLNPQQGQCCIRDQAGNQLPICAGTRKYMAYVPQGNTIFSGTIVENMRMVAPEATDARIEETLRTACAWDFVKELPDGIYSRINEGGNDFSEGQNQRLSIARALLRDAPVLLLDEATSALDVATERKLLRNIMRKEQNRTCILTTHRPTVLTMCDRVYKIEDTRMDLVAEDQLEQMMKEF